MKVVRKGFSCSAELSNLGGILKENHGDTQAGIVELIKKP